MQERQQSYSPPQNTNHKIWEIEEILALFNLPFFDLLNQAHEVHRQHFDPYEIQVGSLLNIKTGGCPENCSYCPQSAHYNTGVAKETLMTTEAVLERARQAKAAGASRFCMGAAWRNPRDEDLEKVIEMVKGVNALEMESCITLGMLKAHQAKRLKEIGLDYYNHNIDTSPDFYDKIITTRKFEDRIETLQHVRDAGIKVCCGGILGMGESLEDRAQMLQVLANLPVPPESVPINKLLQIPGTPLETAEAIDNFDFIRVIAVTRILMPTTMVRFSAGRIGVSEEMQTLCFYAGCNSIFYGEKLLVTPNPVPEEDQALFKKLGLRPMPYRPDPNQQENFHTDASEATCI